MEYQFKNSEEKLLHIIRVNGSTFDDYLEAVQYVQNIDYTDANDRGFLHEAVTYRKSEMALDLMRRGINPDLQEVNGYTAAMLMASEQQWDLLRTLLQYRPDLNLKNWRYGNSLLWEAVSCQTEEGTQIAQELVRAGANPYSQNRYGKSPMDLAAVQQNDELIRCFSQVERPAAEQEEKFRIPKNAAGIFAVRIKEYRKYILVKGMTARYLEDKINSYAAICGGRKTVYKIRLVPVPNTDWVVIACPEKMDFYNYHNLMSWFWGTPEDTSVPQHNICAALHEDERRSYYGIIEDLNRGDRIAGRFQNGESFSIYLPEAYKKGGNAKSYSDVLPVRNIKDYLLGCGFDEQWISESAGLPFQEVEAALATS